MIIKSKLFSKKRQIVLVSKNESPRLFKQLNTKKKEWLHIFHPLQAGGQHGSFDCLSPPSKTSCFFIFYFLFLKQR